MEFSSLIFIFRFLPVFFVIYYVAPKKWRNFVLFVGSLVFYACGDIRYLLLIILSVWINCVVTYEMSRCVEGMALKKLLFTGLLCGNIGVLLFFKYSGYTMPIGMSFYTFTVLSYIIDVYTGAVTTERCMINAGVYMIMFPKVLSGPIARYRDMSEQIRKRTVTSGGMEQGMTLFVIGLGFKVILANHFGMLWHDICSAGFDSISTPLAWIGAVGYSAQLFFDFQGYSLMAVGVGRWLGFYLPQNFNHPYRAKTVGEFYQRWHMTLGQWFKNYLYIPLGGNRKGTFRMVGNLLLVWLITGIWHGATCNFVLWGMLLGFFIVGEKLIWGKYLQKSRILGRVYIWILIPLTWIIFAVEKSADLKVYFSRLFPFWGSANYIRTTDYIRYLKNYTLFFALAFLVSLPYMDKLYKKYHNRTAYKLMLLVVFAICIYELANGLNNPFLYFRF